MVRSSVEESCCPSSRRRFQIRLREDLGKLLARGGMRVPAIRVLLDVFIGQHRLKRAAMQVEVKHIRGSKRRGGKSAHKQFVNGAVSLNADGGRRAGDTMGRDDQTHLGSGRRQGNGWAIVECSSHATFRMGAHPIWSASKRLLDDFQIRASW